MKTTKENADQKIHDEIVGHLQDLLEKNYDAEKGYTKAMKDAKNPNLKHYFQRQAAQRSRFVTELTDELRNLNADADDKGSFTGDLHRTWIDIKTAFTGKDDEAVLEECIRGDKASAEEYEEKMRECDFPPRIAEVLRKQSADIHTTLSRIKRLEDLADYES